MQARLRRLVSPLLCIGFALCGPALANNWPSQWPDPKDPMWTEVEAAHEAWSDDFFDHLAQADDPALRIAAIGRSSMLAGVGRETIDPAQAIRDLAAAANDPAAGAVEIWAAVDVCMTLAGQGESLPKCVDAIGFDRLHTLEPGNAAVDLVRLGIYTGSQDTAGIDTLANRKRLARAARGDRYDEHWGGLLLPVTEAAIRFEKTHPVKTTWDIPGTEDLHMVNTMLIGGFLSGLHGLQVSTLCNAQLENQREQGIRDCLALAELMETSSRTQMTRLSGRTIRLAMTGLEEGSPEWTRARQARFAQHWQWQCQAPAWMLDPFRLRKAQLPFMTADQFLAYARALSEYGEVEGNRRLATADYVENPRNYALDPARCDVFAQLDDATLDQLAVDGPEHSIVKGVATLVELGEIELD